MTDSTLISRDNFIAQYREIFDRIFEFDEIGECRARLAGKYEILEFEEMNLPAWSADEEVFQRFIDFISVVTTPVRLVLTEVESAEMFTETRVVAADRKQVNQLWIRSYLPHFETVCFDESARWGAIFNNFKDKAYFFRFLWIR